jgi:hypothetical protein
MAALLDWDPDTPEARALSTNLATAVVSVHLRRSVSPCPPPERHRLRRTAAPPLFLGTHSPVACDLVLEPPGNIAADDGQEAVV